MWSELIDSFLQFSINTFSPASTSGVSTHCKVDTSKWMLRSWFENAKTKWTSCSTSLCPRITTGQGKAAVSVGDTRYFMWSKEWWVIFGRTGASNQWTLCLLKDSNLGQWIFKRLQKVYCYWRADFSSFISKTKFWKFRKSINAGCIYFINTLKGHSPTLKSSF